MEKFNYRSSTTLAKSIGTLVSIIGALIVTLYQGPSILGISPHSNAPFHTLTSSSAWLVGGLLLTVDSLVSSIFIITQVEQLTRGVLLVYIVKGGCYKYDNAMVRLTSFVC